MNVSVYKMYGASLIASDSGPLNVLNSNPQLLITN